MTTPRYATTGCAAGSQVSGDASSDAWYLNFNNGNANTNNRNNECFVLAVRPAGVPGEYPGAAPEGIRFPDILSAFQRARQGKRPSVNQLQFELRWMDNLLEIQDQINAGTWSPRPTTCFIATRPKAREIHAPDFADRVVHHLVVPPLEAVCEPTFISDSYANRSGKGSHAAVRQLVAFVRQVASGQGGGYFLQLDIHNCFNSVKRKILYGLLKARMQRAGISLPIQHAVHALLRLSPLEQGVHYRASAEERAQVPPHKRLENAPPGCGIPIGNLSSQFFINVYLNELDQFVKHVLKAKRYLRYVDDFVLVHRDREQLLAWQHQIEAFLASRLNLSLKADIRLQPLTDGIDFLGYIVRPSHTLVRRRVVSHARQALSGWAYRHVTAHGLQVTPQDLRDVSAIWASYEGHFDHASSYQLRRDFHRRFPWLAAATRRRNFDLRSEGRLIELPSHFPRIQS
jgi:retron-type reverse transcriptase